MNSKFRKASTSAIVCREHADSTTHLHMHQLASKVPAKNIMTTALLAKAGAKRRKMHHPCRSYYCHHRSREKETWHWNEKVVGCAGLLYCGEENRNLVFVHLTVYCLFERSVLQETRLSKHRSNPIVKILRRDKD